MEINYLLSLYRNGLHNVSRFILCKVRTYVRGGPVCFGPGGRFSQIKC